MNQEIENTSGNEPNVQAHPHGGPGENVNSEQNSDGPMCRVQRSCSASEVVQPCGCIGLNTCPLCENRQVTQAELNEFFIFVGGIAEKMKKCSDEMVMREALKRFSQEEIDEYRKGDPENFRDAILARLVEEEKALELLPQNETNQSQQLDIEESY